MATQGTDNKGFIHGSINDDLHKDRNDNSDKESPNSSVEVIHADKKTNLKKQAKNDNEDVEDEEVDISCGIWKFRTTIFGTWFSNLYVFAVCVGIATLFTYMVTEILQVQLTSLERQFNIDNAHAGLFDTFFKAGYLCTILLAGHFTKKAHIPMIVGLSGVVQGLLLLIPPILQFVDPYELPLLSDTDNTTTDGGNKNFVCHPLDMNGTTSNSTSETKDVNRLAYNLLLMLQAMKGVTDVFQGGFLPIIYMDDNLVDKSRMGILLGIQTVFQMLAGPLGREINGIISSIPIDLKKTDLKPEDHRFVSAWWLGFLIFGIGTAVFSVPVMLFPRRLVTKRQQKEASDKAVVTFAGGHVDEEVEEIVVVDAPTEALNRRTSFVIHEAEPHLNIQSTTLSNGLSGSTRKQSVSSFINRSRRRSSLFPPVVGPTERKVSITGDIVFEQPVKVVPGDQDGEEKSTLIELLKDFPRALYRIFRKPIFLLLILDVCIISVPLGGISFFRSAYMANEYNVPMSRVAFLSGIATAVGNTGGAVVSSLMSSRVTTKVGYVLIIFFTYLIATCMTPLYLIFGCDNVPVYGAPGEIGIPVNSSDFCSCDSVGQLVSCGYDGNNYFSPCYAGCTSTSGDIFTNCTALANFTVSTVSPGLCATDCERNFLIYVFVHGLQNFVTTSSIIAYKLLVLRSVEPQDRAFGISVYFFFYLLLGIPAPNIFGRVVDGACYIKDGDYCALYNRDTIRYLMSGIDVGLHASSQLTSLMILCYFKWEQKQDRKKEKEKNGNDHKTATTKLEGVEDGAVQSSVKHTTHDSSNNDQRTQL